jgi:molybdate transport system permease protein
VAVPGPATYTRPDSFRRAELSRRAFAIVSFIALAILLAFLTIPIVAVFTNVGPGKLIDSLGDHSAREALRLSLETSAIAMALIVAIGTPAAYLLATRTFRGRALILTLIELPLVVPPAVAGIALLAAFGPHGILGSALSDLGIQLVFETAGVVVALVFVASPFFIRQAVASFAAVPRSMLEVSEELGAKPGRTLISVAIPDAMPGLLSGFSLALGRALGEFGATLMFAGSFPGTTQTAPLAIFAEFNTDFTGALALAAVLIAVAGSLLLTVKLIAGADALGISGSKAR